MNKEDMSEERLESMISNEKEWRRELWRKMESLENEIKTVRHEQHEANLIMNTMKVKIGFIGVFFGMLGGVVLSFLEKKIGQ